MNTKTIDQNINTSFMKKHGNVITIGLWTVVLASHAILLPKLVHDLIYDRH